MGKDTAIPWAHHTFNPWRGCAHKHLGCVNCYAELLAKRNPKLLGTWGAKGTRVVGAESYWQQPLRWNEAARLAGERHRVFCASLADVFEDWWGHVTSTNGTYLRSDFRASSSEQDRIGLPEVRRRLFSLIDETPHLDWMILTKRPENIVDMMPPRLIAGNVQPCYRKNLWLGTSISDQQTADTYVPRLMQASHLASVLFVSAEPLLAPIGTGVTRCRCRATAERCSGHDRMCPLYEKDVLDILWLCEGFKAIDWVIVGGESGGKRRDCGVSAIVDLAAQARRANTPVFVKQDCALKDNQRGRIPEDVWTLKEFPSCER